MTLFCVDGTCWLEKGREAIGEAELDRLCKNKVRERYGKRARETFCLFTFTVYRDLPGLVDTLHDVLNDPQKHTLYHHICQLLPEEIQSEFDQLASKAVAHGKLHFKFKLKY